MALLECNKHGAQAPSFVSENVANLVRGGEIEKCLFFEEITVYLPFDKKGVFLVDSDFIKEFKLSRVVDDEELGFEIYSMLVPVCSKCVQNWRENNI